ncbi:MAG: alkaline phosphatase D family protein [Mycobacteriaceae bacterium]
MDYSRRQFLRTSSLAAAGAGTLAVLPSLAAADSSVQAFQHGVASGDPTDSAVIIWTRVTPSLEAVPGSGFGAGVQVSWTVATDPDMARVISRGMVTTSADSDHTVKIDVQGLASSTLYFYQFLVLDGEVAGQRSAVGKTRTAPANDADIDQLRFGVVSCSNWEAGFFGAYRHLSYRDDLDAIIHLGDYIYEYGTGGYPGKFGVVRPVEPSHEIVSLQDYRIRHGLYKTDPDLQAAHRAVPWICTWDDHESTNDAYDSGAQNHQPNTEGDWNTRKKSSEQAYYEWIPVRVAGSDNNRHLYRRLRFGTLMELSMLDLRTYRSKQAPLLSAQVDTVDRTITGAEQMQWLTNGVVTSAVQWKIIGNPVMISPLLIPPLEVETTRALTSLLGLPAGGVPPNTDAWDGYTADRQRLLTALVDNGVQDTVFITGDIHTSWACDIPVDPANYPGAGTIATELVVTSVTSVNFDDFIKIPEHTAGRAAEQAIKAANHHVQFLDVDAHGFGVFTVTKQAAQMDYWFLAAKEDPNSEIYCGASYEVVSGAQRTSPAVGPQ